MEIVGGVDLNAQMEAILKVLSDIQANQTLVKGLMRLQSQVRQEKHDLHGTLPADLVQSAIKINSFRLPDHTILFLREPHTVSGHMYLRMFVN